MTLRRCECSPPNPKPQKPSVCVRCSYLIDPEWSCNRDNTRAFLAELAQALPGRDLDAFAAQILERQKAGESTFRQTFHARDNLAEAQEEAADLAMYACLHLLVERRAGVQEERDLALSIAHHAYQAHNLLNRWRAKEHGSP